MAGDDCGEVKEFVGRIGRTPHVHGEMSSAGQNADFGFMQIIKERHVRHDIGIARDVNRAPLCLYHKTTFAAHCLQAVFRAVVEE